MAKSHYLWMAAVGMALAGCSSLSNSLGLNPQGPDEFRVVAKAPLVMPPDFSLRPPAPGAPRPQEINAQKQARAALLAQPVAGVGGGVALLGEAPGAVGEVRTAGEVALLGNAGATNADPGIRALVDFENAQLLEQGQGFMERILFWEQPPLDVIEPVAEAKRLRAEGNVAVPGPVARRL
jgi:hypothetical protein